MLDGGADIEVEGLGWRPWGRREPVLSGVDLRIPAGQRVLLVGPSGAGKTTLLRAVGGLLEATGTGDLSGQVRIGGRVVSGAVDSAVRAAAGMMFQDPRAGLVAETVGRDVAFGLENQGVARDRIWERVRASVRDAAFPYELDHPTSALSGGEQQRLALAGALVLGSRVSLLDEPTSMLDHAAGDSVRAAVRRDAFERGTTVVIVDHHIEPWLDFADRIVVLGATGSVEADGPPRPVLQARGRELAALGVWVPGLPPPQLVEVDASLVEPVDRRSAELVRAVDAGVELRTGLTGGRPRTTTALRGVSAALVAGRALAVTGPSGAGKSTLIALLAGLLAPTAGTVLSSPELAVGRERRPWRWRSRDLVTRLSWVAQLPEHAMVARTVHHEVLASSRSCDREPAQARRRADGLLEALGLDHLREASPYHLSGGEQRRLMVAAAIAHGPSGVLLDEPTVGQDRLTWSVVVGVAASARSAGTAIAVASHDRLATDALADDRLHLDHGVLTR